VWHNILEDLDHALQPLWITSDKRYEALFTLQALTRLATSSYLVAQVKTSCTDLDDTARSHAFKPLDRSHQVVELVLRKILTELKRDEVFERKVKYKSPHRDFLLAMINRGPPNMDFFFYYYGILDCGTQLARIIPNEKIASELRLRMERIICHSREDSYCWKAVSPFQ
jgi:hypothetical protein